MEDAAAASVGLPDGAQTGDSPASVSGVEVAVPVAAVDEGRVTLIAGATAGAALNYALVEEDFDLAVAKNREAHDSE